MAIVTVRFERIQRSRTVKTKCTGPCKQRHTKVVKVEQTLNPFNRRADGTPKTGREVLDAVLVELGKRVAEYTKMKTAEPCKLCGGLVVEVKPKGKQ